MSEGLLISIISIIAVLIGLGIGKVFEIMIEDMFDVDKSTGIVLKWIVNILVMCVIMYTVYSYVDTKESYVVENGEVVHHIRRKIFGITVEDVNKTYPIDKFLFKLDHKPIEEIDENDSDTSESDSNEDDDPL